MSTPILKSLNGVTLKWGVGYTLPGYIVQNATSETNADVAKTLDEKGSIVGYSFYNLTRTLKVSGVIKDATVLPAPGDEITVNEVKYFVMPPVTEEASNNDFTKFTLSLERAEDNALPA